MKIALCNETYRNWPLEQALSHAAGLGYEGIEIAPFTLTGTAARITPDIVSQVAGIARRCHLQIIGLHWLLAGTQGLHLTSPRREVRQRTSDYLAELTRICRDLGGQVMVFGSPGQRNRAEGISLARGHQLAEDCLTPLVPVLETSGVTLALEPLGPEEGNFLNTAAETRQLVERFDSPHIRLHLDVKAMSTESQPIPQIIEDHAGVLAHFHCNDPNRRGPGMGDVDFGPILGTLKRVGYHGWLSVEVFDDSLPPEQLAGDSIGYLRQQLARLAGPEASP